VKRRSIRAAFAFGDAHDKNVASMAMMTMAMNSQSPK
jgi:hypothetical protein